MVSLSRLIAQTLPEPELRRRARLPQVIASRIVILARFPNPTFDYYLKARMNAPGQPPAHHVDIRGPMPSDIEAKGAYVIICRYISSAALAWIERNDNQLAGVAFFTDDDVSTFVLSSDAKPGYRLFLFSLALWPLRRLNRVLDRLYVSTPALARRFERCDPVILAPAPPPELFEASKLSQQPSRPIKILFHAKAIHDTEHAFLAPILRGVLECRSNIAVEISGDETSLYHWQGIEAITLVPEIPWLDYIEKTRRDGADIVLVPLMPSPANANRADTKRIDVARLGGAGIFSVSAAYGQADASGEILLPNEAARWFEAIIGLIDDPDRRQTAALATRLKVEAMAARARTGFPSL